MLSGPAGIGKSTLASWAAAEFSREGRRAVCVPLAASAGHGEVRLWPSVARALAEQRTSAERGTRHPGVPVQPRGDSASSLTLLEDVRDAGVAVLIIDALEHGDPEGLRAFVELAPDAARHGLLCIVTLRGADAHVLAEGRALLRGLVAGAEVLDVAPFSHNEVAAALGQRVPGLPAARLRALAAALYAHSAGLPFLVEVLLAGLATAPGELPDPAALESGGWGSAAITAAITQLHSLPVETRRCLAVTAALTGQADASLLTRILDRVVDADLTVARGSGLLRTDGGRLRLAHPVYDRACRRVPLAPTVHHAIADALAERDLPHTSRQRLHHLERAGDLVPRAELHTAAAATAARLGTAGRHADAAEASTIAARSAADAGLDLWVAAATAFHRANEPERAWQAASRVAAAGSSATPAQEAQAALAYAHGRSFHSEAGDALAWLQRARVRLDPTDPLAAATLAAEGRLACEVVLSGPATLGGEDEAQRWRSNVAEAAGLVDAAVAQPGLRGDTAAQVYLAWHAVHSDPSRRGERAAAITMASDAARDDALRGAVALAGALDAVEGGQRVRANRLLGEVDVAVARSGDAELRWRAQIAQVALARASGDVAGATARTAAVERAGVRRRQRGAGIVTLTLSASLELEQGWVGPATHRLFAERANVVSPLFGAGLLHLATVAGRLAPDAPEIADEVRRARERTDARWLLCAVLLADVVASSCRSDLADGLLESLNPHREVIAVDHIDGLLILGAVGRVVGRLLGLQGRSDEARAVLDDAVVRNRRAGLELYALESELDLIELGVVGRAGALHVAGRAATAAGRLGLGRLVRRAAGLALPARALRLTPRERAVLQGIVEGRTNREIADRIGFSHGTVRKDLRAVCSALDVEDRHAAAERAVQFGLVTAPSDACPSEAQT